MNNESNFNLDSLLDGTLDDLADIPEFRPFNPGAYRLNFAFEQDKKTKHVYFAKLKVLEVLEQANPEDVPMEIGAETSVRYDLSNEYGQGAFKKILAVAAAHFGAKKNSELIEDMKNVEVVAITKHNVNKKNNQIYTDIVEVQMV